MCYLHNVIIPDVSIESVLATAFQVEEESRVSVRVQVHQCTELAYKLRISDTNTTMQWEQFAIKLSETNQQFHVSSI